MTSLRLEYNEDTGRQELVAVEGDGRNILAEFTDPTAATRALHGAHAAYNYGRRDEGVIRAAAFRGLMAASPLA